MFIFLKKIKCSFTKATLVLFSFFIHATFNANTYIVTNLLNTGLGSLRQAIIDANTNPGNDLIIFNLGAGGPFTINITTVLPNLTDPAGVTIDGWNNSGNNGTPNTVPVFNATTGTPLNPVYAIILGNGNNVPTGLIIASDNNLVQGLVLQNFGDNTVSANDIAITITGNTNTVVGCYIGVDQTGITKGTKTAIGIQVSGATNLIGDGTAAGANLISGMNGSLHGVFITGATATGNLVKGNIIGLQKDGSTLVTGGAQQNGVNITASAASNVIGGSVAGEGNVISGNTANGISISSTAATGNSVMGNIIGTRASGNATVTTNPQQYGIYINGSPNNVIGGNSAGTRNIISANESMGIRITGASTGNVIKGNCIGIDITGTTYIVGSTQDRGIYIDGTSTTNTIGGLNAGEGNLISGHSNLVPSAEGIVLTSSNGNNYVLGNTIGPQANGSSWITGNPQQYGIFIQNSPNNVIGGNTPGARNVISANETMGIRIYGATSIGNVVKGNYIGINTAGTGIIVGSTQDRGVYVDFSAVTNTIGGSAAGEGNVISGQINCCGTAEGIYLSTTAPATGNLVIGNIIGLQANGTSYVASNGQATGITITGSPGNTIGGSTAGERNLISGNETYGINITGAGSTGNWIKGNYIGLESTGTTFVTGSTQNYGIQVTGSAASTTIGGINAGEGNLISGNSASGIFLASNAAIGSSIQQNTIGAQRSGTLWVTGNVQSSGIQLNPSTNNFIGGSTASARNIISGNSSTGISLQGAGTSGNTVRGNYIGIGADGITRIVGNTQQTGIYIWNGPNNNMFGGVNPGEGNVMSGNSFQGQNSNSGIGVNNIFYGNIVGPQANGISNVAGNNQIMGFNLNSAGTIIGGSSPGMGNVISANTSMGIYHALAQTSLTIIKGNCIGPGSNSLAIPGTNQATGIQIQQSSHDNYIGGYLGAMGTNPEGNLIAFNTGVGINITSTLAISNLISRNLIYTNGPVATPVAIRLNYGVNQGNSGKPAPVVMTSSATIVTGSNAATAGVGDSVEVFKNATPNCKDAKVYLGTTLADAAGNWTLTGVTINAGETVIATARTVANRNTSEFSNCIIVLPIELMYFEATCDGKKTKLKWATATEQNNDYFDVERSVDAQNFESIGKIKGAGNSIKTIHYSFMDPNPLPGGAYYRLKQTDLDKTFDHSEITYGKGCFDNEPGSAIYPNPVNDDLTIDFSETKNETVDIEIVDMLGKVLMSGQYTLAGKNELGINTNTLAEGIYFLNINSPSLHEHIKFVKN